MFKIILKNKNFSSDSLSKALEKTGKSRKDFLKNYGIIFESAGLKEASSFSRTLFNDFQIETFVTDLYYPLCKQPVEPDFFRLNSAVISNSKKEFPVSRLKAGVLASCRIFAADLSPFKLKVNFEKNVSQNAVSFFILLDFGSEILLLRPENLDYSAIFNEPSPSSMDNFRRLLCRLYEMNPAVWNKTADLFVVRKDIQYFTYEDLHDALKELSWVKVINGIEALV